MDTYDEKLIAWKRAHGVPEEQAAEDIPAGELRMMEEDAKSTGKSYCWMCAEEFPIRDMVIETSPYNQMDEEAMDETGYVPEPDRVRKCKACVKREEDEFNGVEEGQDPNG